MIIASSPLYFRGKGMAFRRAVLKQEDGKFVVHDQFFYTEEDDHGKRIPVSFGNGVYIVVRNHQTPADAFVRAHEVFTERCQKYASETHGPEATARLATTEEAANAYFEASVALAMLWSHPFPTICPE